ncbi:bifunctional phosphoribosylaminoimidazolecarboxamide formyltransferase/inosine monophosphate cyclohydrolase [Candidatus Pantoea edessiphila]|uniref:Bifunctional purine biosynthesis protein PurH n=1 Tax=Candidatus Pantoea edessiphila TaxID=2044610 RepID=A0A2P5T125_9GAMM|nr:bifunctional phosphoribosylaminoimidazolecarboxamide formyltransferase/IMP cyclohydrolase [Candidatus Pantoea edessiphila]PPI88287.1 bifunctional phosphoribosylaminoimidazolecarboxamide formyltransferase/inosine monophosphate cyclohydrolase [Candidatus Pantoea edessiphila]
MQKNNSIRYVLISVFDKTGIINFAKELHNRNIKILATSGTAILLMRSGIPIIEVSKYTGFPEMINGRVKTLHSKIYAGILYRRGKDDNLIQDNDIFPIDMVVANFYPFMKTITRDNCCIEEAIENIDIGGPTMVCSAAKNYKFVSVVVKNTDYDLIIDELDINNNSLTLDTRLKLASKAFKYLNIYSNIISDYFNNLRGDLYNNEQNNHITDENILPEIINIKLIKKKNMLYGENNHQSAAFYIQENKNNKCMSNLLKIQGKKLSYNNIIDINTAIECLKEFNQPACVIIKHANPCGVAINHSIDDAYKRAYNTDPVSAFGGVVALNCILNKSTIELIINNQFLEVLIAPSITEIALKIINKKKKIRLVTYNQHDQIFPQIDFKSVIGGFLIQQHNLTTIENDKISVVTNTQPNEQQMNDAIFCWKVSKFVKSNAIVCAINGATIGIGAGQMSRIDAVKIAAIKANNAKLQIKNCVMASDAFFPFRDNIDIAAEMGISCIIQPGGSIRDKEIIKAANEHNISMIFTKIRHFRH